MFGLMPKEDIFFTLIESSALNAHEGAKALADLLDNYTDVETKRRHIKDLEHKGDEITHQIFEQLNKTFITPLDREDIHAIASRLDDVLDFIDASANRLLLYKPGTPGDDAKAMGRVLIQATAVLVDATRKFKNLKDPAGVIACCRQVHLHENEADKLSQHALATLFENAQNAVEIIKWKDIIEDLETATDRCEDVANALEGVVIKNT